MGSSPNIPLSSTGFFVDFLFVKGSDKEFFEDDEDFGCNTLFGLYGLSGIVGSW